MNMTTTTDITLTSPIQNSPRSKQMETSGKMFFRHLPVVMFIEFTGFLPMDHDDDEMKKIYVVCNNCQ